MSDRTIEKDEAVEIPDFLHGRHFEVTDIDEYCISGSYNGYFYFEYIVESDSLSLLYNGDYEINFKSICYFASEANLDVFLLSVCRDLISVLEGLDI